MSEFPEQDEHLDQLIRSLRANGGFTPMEADEDLNLSARDLIFACIRRWGGTAFVGVFNEFDRLRARDPEQALRQVGSTSPVFTFSCDFAVPQKDPELARLILDYRESPSMARIEAVMTRVKALGGVTLTWS